MLRLLPLPQWPVYSTTLKKVIDKNGAKVYQGQELKRFHEAANRSECLSVCIQEWPGLTQKGQINTIIDTYVSIFLVGVIFLYSLSYTILNFKVNHLGTTRCENIDHKCKQC